MTLNFAAYEVKLPAIVNPVVTGRSLVFGIKAITFSNLVKFFSIQKFNTKHNNASKMEVS